MTLPAAKKTICPPSVENISPELAQKQNWVCYGAPDRELKMPFHPGTGTPAKAGHPSTWGTLQDAVKAVQEGQYLGIGYEFAGDGIVGIDLDHCLEGGKVVSWAQKIVDRFGSYTELSPSCKGLHILCKGSLPGKGVKKNQVEMYDRGRYFTVTGWVLGQPRPLKDCQQEIEWLYRSLKEPAPKETKPAVPLPDGGCALSDGEILLKAQEGRKGEDFSRLWKGDSSGYGSQSEADLALCNILAFYSGKDPAVMDRLFRQSGLYREKWDQKHGSATYGEMTIQKAIDGTVEVYTQKHPREKPVGEKKELEIPALETVSARALQQMELPPVEFVVEGLLPKGLGLLAAPPKYGKSWMMLSLCLAVAAGEPFLGYHTRQQGCLYLALEDSMNRLQGRMDTLLEGQPAPAGFDYSIQALGLGMGLLEQLEGYLQAHPETGLVVIDTFQKIRGSAKAGEGAYAADYREVAQLKAFADQKNIALLLVHHTRKMVDETDPFNRISGTTGILGAADTVLVLTRQKRGEENALLSLTGRDVDSAELMLRFDSTACRWENLGPAENLTQQQELEDYLESPLAPTVNQLLEDSPQGWKGSASQLMEKGREITGRELADNPRQLTGVLKRYAPLLQQQEGICYQYQKNGGGGGKHCFSYY